jgi:hypothetical protein
MTSFVFWHVTPFSTFKVNRLFGGTCCLHLQYRSVSEETSTKQVELRHVPPKRWLILKVLRRYIPEGRILRVFFNSFREPTESKHITHINQNNECMADDWIQLAQDSNQWLTFIITIILNLTLKVFVTTGHDFELQPIGSILVLSVYLYLVLQRDHVPRGFKHTRMFFSAQTSYMSSSNNGKFLRIQHYQ